MAQDLQQKTFNYNNHNIAYTKWGTGSKLLVCTHGLTRNGRDFDFLAQELAAHYTVICPDMPGRGKSDWLDDFTKYNNNYYVELTVALIKDLGFEKVDWVGTSMGGLMGMIATALHPHLIGKMVLNDIGPFISAEGMRRIATYIKDEVKFPTQEVAQNRFREIYAPFKIDTEEHWQHFFEHGLRESDAGHWSFNHDPKLGQIFKDKDGNIITMQEFDLWRIWDAIHIPTLVLRGETSDILSRDVAARMAQKAKLAEFAGFGHVPPLINAQQISAVKEFLLA
jgi:pimeloyl-ACP methyl ester carboxylesterase